MLELALGRVREPARCQRGLYWYHIPFMTAMLVIEKVEDNLLVQDKVQVQVQVQAQELKVLEQQAEAQELCYHLS